VALLPVTWETTKNAMDSSSCSLQLAIESRPTIAEITAVAHEAQTAERRGGRRPSERIFRRQVSFRTFRGMGSVPAWAAGLAADETFGPFRGANDRPFWFDVFAAAPQILVVRGARGPVLLTVPQPQPVPGSRVEFILPRGVSGSRPSCLRARFQTAPSPACGSMKVDWRFLHRRL
jgi:hypothetical protein